MGGPGSLEWSRHGVEAIEKIVMTQSEGFALHFEIPAVLPRAGAEAFVLVGVCG